MEGSKKEMKFPLLVHQEMIKVVVQHHRLSNYTKFQIGKDVIVVREKKLFDPELWPLYLQSEIGEMQIKSEVTYSREHNRYILKVNGVAYNELPYVPPNKYFFRQSTSVGFLEASIMLNEH